MRILRTLLISQLLSALVLAAAAMVILVKYTQQQLNSSEDNVRVAVEQILNHHITGDGKVLSRQLDRSFNLKKLRISQLDGTVLHEQNSSTDGAPVATLLLELFGTEFKQQTLRNQDQNIQLSYQLDFTARLQPQQWLIQIEDNGPGLSHQQLDHLFTPFYTTRESGLGLGLTLCETLVQRMGGDIKAANSEYGGACFTLTFPLIGENTHDKTHLSD